MTIIPTPVLNDVRPVQFGAWPYPLLCLLWRLGLGGAWLPLPPAPASRGLLVASVQALAAIGAPPEEGSRAPRHPGADQTLVAALDRVLARSALGRLAGPTGDDARRATGCQLLEQSLMSAGRRGPPILWHGLLAHALAPARRLWVPRPRPAYDPATWQIVGVLEEAWEVNAVSFVGRQRSAIFHVIGTRRMARRFGVSWRRALACGRSATRLWRYWYETYERPRLGALTGLALPAALVRAGVTAEWCYRQLRHEHRQGEAVELPPLPPEVRQGLATHAAASVRELRPYVRATWQPPSLEPLGVALLLSPLGLAAARAHRIDAVHQAARDTADRLVRLMTAPWPWRPRPVIRGPRRLQIEARRQARRLAAQRGGRG